ncbi:hypothetical protein SDC9_146325 [bioreactor metagenome]|uniref:Uncharacterized protein n=1 Tax=bioreactor metagenome TaxID=1076179 RepID=A0A645EAR0_9ZZZZ
MFLAISFMPDKPLCALRLSKLITSSINVKHFNTSQPTGVETKDNLLLGNICLISLAKNTDKVISPIKAVCMTNMLCLVFNFINNFKI